MLKTVSVIVCTYNSKDDLKECLDSLVNQDYNKLDIIVVDDASTDETKEFLNDYLDSAPIDISVITNKRNLGVAGSRNVGIHNSKGDIIAFTDSDCVADRNWISELVKTYDHHEVAAVGGSILDGRTTKIWELVRKGHDFIAPNEGYVPFIKGCNMSFKREVLETYSFNNELKYGYEELLLCDYLVDDGHKIYYQPSALVYHKHRSKLITLLKQTYQRGFSSVWYLKKRKKFFLYRRHFILLLALILVPLFNLSTVFILTAILFIVIVCLHLLYEEILFNKKSKKEIFISFPFLLFIECFHFCGAIAGLLKFRVFNRNSTN